MRVGISGQKWIGFGNPKITRKTSEGDGQPTQPRPKGRKDKCVISDGFPRYRCAEETEQGDQHNNGGDHTGEVEEGYERDTRPA